jgi:hypothetical protein
MDPGSGSGVTVLKDSGFARPHFRHSGLDPESMFIGTRRRKRCRKDRKTLRKDRNISGHLQPINMDPGSSPGVTGEGGTWTPDRAPG